MVEDAANVTKLVVIIISAVLHILQQKLDLLSLPGVICRFRHVNV